MDMSPIIHDFINVHIDIRDFMNIQGFLLISMHGLNMDSRSRLGGCLILYRPAMSFGSREIYFRGSFQLHIVTI